MKCPHCDADILYVVDSRMTEIDGYKTVRRRRVCRKCKYRWSTIEVPLGERRRHDAVKILSNIRENLSKALILIDELNQKEEK
jgi:transcriptional regulator NrdR family protein